VEDLDFGFNYSTFNGKRLLKAQDVYFKYSLDQDEFLINDLNLEIEQEDCIAVIGKNGRGKSTILNILAGLLPPVEGEVVPSPNLKIGHFGQTNIDRLNPKHTVEEEIASANHNLSVTDVRGICGVMMFDGDKAKKSISVLSGGERSRVLLGKILATPCNILFLDEPTHHLDMESIEALISAINEFPGVVIIVTHSEQILKQLPITKLLICRNHTQELMIGDYMDFLEKDGWGDDKEAAKQNKSQKEKVSQQDQKKLSAEIRQQISQNLGPLRKRMEELEKLIVKNEKLLATANDKLIEASEAEQSALIQKFSKEIATVQKQIDNDFAELDRVSKEYESKKLAFENQ
jgi:ATP-binding cassette subfamily F protein 3